MDTSALGKFKHSILLNGRSLLSEVGEIRRAASNYLAQQGLKAQ
jgi:hypothetical protein